MALPVTFGSMHRHWGGGGGMASPEQRPVEKGGGRKERRGGGIRSRGQMNESDGERRPQQQKQHLPREKNKKTKWTGEQCIQR